MSLKRLPLLAVLVAVVSILMVGPAPEPTEASSRVDVLIGFESAPGASERALVRSAGGSVRYSYTLVPAIAASVPEAAIPGLLKSPRITVIEPDIEVQAIEHDVGTWGVERIGSPAAHHSGFRGAGVKVAIIDSGIDYTHPDLAANYAGGYDYRNDDSDPMDDNDHGTHVAGTVAAVDDGVGVVGVAPDAQLFALKVLSSSGSGSYSDIVAALNWSVLNGMDVTNNSYGSSTNPGSIVQAAFDAADAAGILNVAAAGNSGRPNGKGNTVIWPAAYDSVVAVSATDSNDVRASFSSTGDRVEIAAPGVAVLSTVIGGGYASWSGTSMATPHVVGAAALAIGAGVGDVRDALQSTADDLGDPGRDPWYGFGLVDADEVVLGGGPVNAAPTVSISSPADGATFDSGAPISFAGSAGDAEDGDLTGSIDWTSSIDGAIGTGGSFSTALSDGEHTITASVTDSGGLSDSASVSITVGTPPPPPAGGTMYVDSVEWNSRKMNLAFVIHVTDGASDVSDALVTATLCLTGGSCWNFAGTTNSSGDRQFKLVGGAPSGEYTATVTGLTHNTLTWDAGLGITESTYNRQ